MTMVEKDDRSVTSSLNAVGQLRVYIDGILHLMIETKKLAEIESWKMTTRNPVIYMIERTYSDGTINYSEYNDVDLWASVLGAIDNAYGKVPR